MRVTTVSTEAAPTTVFIAEDNPILLQGLKRALASHGYAVNTAMNGKEMLDLLQASPLPDILLVDVMMPVMNGLELLDAVRTNPRTAEIPVMLITAAAEQMVPGSALVSRKAEVLMKPFKLADLLSRIQQLVSERVVRASGGSMTPSVSATM